MEETKNISSTVVQSEAQMDDERIQEQAHQGYFRPFWEAYKGHVRGLLVGVVVGALLATGIGLAVAGVAGLGGAALWATIALFSGGGALMGANIAGDVGAASSARAVGLAEKHARMLDPAYKNSRLGAIDDKLMVGGHGHHYEFPHNRDKHKFFSWKSGAIGLTIGSITGGLLGHAAVATTAAASLSALTASLPLLAPVIAVLGGPVLAPVALGALCLGLFGLSFGVDRSIFKSVFNVTDANSRGHIVDFSEPDLGKTQSLGRETPDQLERHREQRQEDIHALTQAYSKKIFWGSLNGTFRGIAGGLVIGALIGLGIGLIAAFGLPLLGVHVAAAAVTSIFCGAGALMGMSTFSDIGKEAGAESTARAIDNEFEYNQALLAKGITPPAPQKSEGNWFNLKTALIMGGVGAVLGVPLAGFLGIAGVIGHLSLIAASSLSMGLVGAASGLGSKPLHAINSSVTKLYDRSYLGSPEENSPLAGTYVPAPLKENQIMDEELAQLRAREQQRSNDKSFVQSLNTQPSLSVGIQ